MPIYFGSTGFIELKRDALNSDLETSLDPADVNTTKKRFSVDNAAGSLITGDQIEIETVDTNAYIFWIYRFYRVKT